MSELEDRDAQHFRRVFHHPGDEMSRPWLAELRSLRTLLERARSKLSQMELAVNLHCVDCGGVWDLFGSYVRHEKDCPYGKLMRDITEALAKVGE